MPDCHPQLGDTQRMVRDTIRRVVETELKPHVEKMEHGEPPYPYIKKLAAGLGMAGEGDLPAAMAQAAPEDRLEFFVPAAVGIEIARVCGMEKYEVERLARDAKLMERGGGTTEIQEITIARQLVR